MYIYVMKEVLNVAFVNDLFAAVDRRPALICKTLLVFDICMQTAKSGEGLDNIYVVMEQGLDSV